MAPLSVKAVKLPADVELADRLAFGLTGKQLAILAGTAVAGYGAFLVVSPLLPTPFAIAALALVALGGAFLALARQDGLSGDQLALAIARFALAPKRQLLAPRGLPLPLPCSPPQPRTAPLDIPIRRVLASGLVQVADGSHRLLLSAKATSFELRSADEQAAFVAAFARFLNARTDPVQISVQSEPASLAPQADQIELTATATAAASDGLQAAALDHARFLRTLGETRPLRRRRIVLVLSTRERHPALAEIALTRLAAEATDLLAGADVTLHPLEGDAAAALLARNLDPPGPPEGSHLQGVIHASTRSARFVEPASPPPAGQDASDGLLGPASLELHPDRLRVGDRWQRTFAVSGYPREVGYGWLAQLLRGAPQLDASLQIEPFPVELAAQRLQKQRARFESTRRIEAERGSLADLGVQAAAEDAHQLATRLARRESRLFRAGLYLSLTSDSEAELAQASDTLKALCASQLLTPTPVSFRSLDGWLSSLPLGLDRLKLQRTFDSESLAASFPFAAAEPPLEPSGCFYGLAESGAPIVFDRYQADNYNGVILARSGAGKSYLAKLEALRLLYQGVQVFIVDPEDEYRRLCRSVGGAYLPLAGPDAVTINPLDLPASQTDSDSRERVAFLGELVELLAGGLDGAELAALDRAASAAYASAGITDDPSTHTRQAPLLRDLAHQLQQQGAEGVRLADRISPYTVGALSQLFANPTSIQPSGELVCFSLRGLSERLKPVALLLCLDLIWRSLEQTPRKRCVLVDEAWLIMREPAGARFLHRLAKSARKRWCGLTTITQDAGDLLATELGQAIVSNAASQILLRQAPQAIDRVAEAFRLTESEQHYLLSCPRGHGLFIVGDNRFPLQVLASPAEHPLVTSDPAELAA